MRYLDRKRSKKRGGEVGSVPGSENDAKRNSSVWITMIYFKPYTECKKVKGLFTLWPASLFAYVYTLFQTFYVEHTRVSL